MKKIYGLLIIVVLFNSCLDLKTQINLQPNGSGEWILHYKIPQEAVFITPGDELNGFNFLPSDEAGVIERTDTLDGLLLLEISSQETVDYVEIDARFSFITTDDIESFFNNFLNTSLVRIKADNNGTFSLTLNTPIWETIDEDTLSIINSLYSKSKIEITVELPGIVKNSSIGLLPENPSQAELTINTTDLLSQKDPLKWKVNYE